MKEISNNIEAVSWQVKEDTGKAYDIPVSGSLGLLALGFKGTVLWRRKRKNLLDQQISSNSTSNE